MLTDNNSRHTDFIAFDSIQLLCDTNSPLLSTLAELSLPYLGQMQFSSQFFQLISDPFS